MNEEIVISVKKLSKDFILPHQKKNSVKSVFTNMLSKGGKAYEVQHALKDISFEVKKGEFFGIVGRNGSGKSTLLKILAGIYQPTKGTVQTTGRIVPFIELGVGFNGELSGRENVYLNGALLGFSEKEIDAKYQDIVDFAEIERFMDQKLKNYSSGMQVRLAFSVATVLAESDILLIDEVLAVGDADFQRKCFDYFKNLKKLNKTVVFVSHDMNAVREYCERAILIEQSKIVAIDSSDKIATIYTKMFNTNKEDEGKITKTNRWGNGQMSIKHVSISPKKITDEQDKITIDCSVVAAQDIEEPIVGFVIKNAQGHGVMGTNTKIQRVKIGNVAKSQQINICWEVKNVLSDGKYSLDIAVLAEDGLTVLDWYETAKSFVVYEEIRSPYPIGNSIKTTIRK